MIHSNFHTHTTWCDGKNSVDEMVQAAISKGMTALGFSGHSYLPYDDTWTMKPHTIPKYVADVRAAQKRYAGQIEIFLGVEDDINGARPDFPHDYAIGSVHSIRVGDRYDAVDITEERLAAAVEQDFGGDWYRMCRAYFELLAQVQTVTGCDFVGHFDLVTKFNEGGKHFDESDPRYRNRAMETLEHLCSQGAVFEVNTGAISRGYRTLPYPAESLLRAMHELGAPIVISGDSHSVDALDTCFPEAVELAKACGYRTHRVLTRSGWQDEAL